MLRKRKKRDGQLVKVRHRDGQMTGSGPKTADKYSTLAIHGDVSQMCKLLLELLQNDVRAELSTEKPEF